MWLLIMQVQVLVKIWYMKHRDSENSWQNYRNFAIKFDHLIIQRGFFNPIFPYSKDLIQHKVHSAWLRETFKKALADLLGSQIFFALQQSPK